MKTRPTIVSIAFFIAFSAIHLCSSSQSCLPERITFTIQAQIDNFQTNYPNCTEIEGVVTISGNDITNLNGLCLRPTLTYLRGFKYFTHRDNLNIINQSYNKVVMP